MSFLRDAARAYVLHRLTQRNRHRRPRSRWQHTYGAPYRPHGRGSRRGSGFRMVGPLPTYSRRTRSGSRVTVSGCCLPIPLTLAAGAGLASRHALRVR